jgi:Mlc titration factor MtfA (ptsG expression regulator)
MFLWLKRRRRRQLLATPYPESWRAIVENNIAHFQLLSDQDQTRLLERLRILVHEKHWEGCEGLAITDEMKVTIAGMASLMLLGMQGDYCFDGISSILIYARTFRRPGRRSSGILVDEEDELMGEAWHGGSIVLSWSNVLESGQNIGNGSNLVIHEFAHHLDGLDGEMGGTPPLPTRHAERNWYAVTQREYERLWQDAKSGKKTLIDPYGTTNRAEFFATSSECFFERPVEMRKRHTELYRLLSRFYQLDPAAWYFRD